MLESIWGYIEYGIGIFSSALNIFEFFAMCFAVWLGYEQIKDRKRTKDIQNELQGVSENLQASFLEFSKLKNELSEVVPSQAARDVSISVDLQKIHNFELLIEKYDNQFGEDFEFKALIRSLRLPFIMLVIVLLSLWGQTYFEWLEVVVFFGLYGLVLVLVFGAKFNWENANSYYNQKHKKALLAELKRHFIDERFNDYEVDKLRLSIGVSRYNYMDPALMSRRVMKWHVKQMREKQNVEE